MPFATDNIYLRIDNFINKPVLIGYPARPAPCEFMFQWFGFTDSDKRGSVNYFNEIIDFLKNFNITYRPFAI